jgi:GMP synthase (glutamine-hydrolysing)
MRFLAIKNSSREGPGLLAEVMVERGVLFDVADLGALDRLPQRSGYDAVIVLGGPQSANDMSDKMRSEVAWVADAVEAGLPYLGVCLGLQVLVKACGGGVVKSPLKEVGFRGPDGGFYSVELTDEGRDDPLFSGMPPVLRIFQLHGETVELTDGMALLGTGRHCRNQVVKANERAYGIQGHFELTEGMFLDWLANDPDLGTVDGDSLRRDYEEVRGGYETVGRGIFSNFIDLVSD